jgi:hypothetical protein
MSKSFNLMEQRQGLYLKAPHAKLLFDNEKKVIIKSKLYKDAISQTYYVIQDDLAYGIILIKSAAPFNLDDFKKYRELHLISDTEREERWPDKETLFAYYFNILEKFPEPRKVKTPKVSQTFVKDIEFLNEKIDGATAIKTFSDIDTAAEFIFTKSHKFAIEKKFSGVRGTIIRREDTVIINTEQGQDVSDRFIFIKEQTKDLSEFNFIVDGEFVCYINNKPQGKEVLNKFLLGEIIEDLNIKMHIFDILFLNEDLRRLSWSERKSKLHSLNFTESIKEVPSIIVDAKDEAVKAMSFLGNLPGSEGAIIKLYTSKYPKGEKTSEWITYKKQ